MADEEIYTEDQATDSFGPIKVESFWGTISSLPILQVFGFILFQNFSAIFSKVSIMSLIVGLFSFVFFIVYLVEQTELFSRIEIYFYQKAKIPNKFIFKDLIKILIGLFFLLFWVLIISGHFPLPNAGNNILISLLFYFLSWSVCYGLVKIKKNPNLMLNEGVIKKNRGLLIIILLPFLFLALSAPPELKYILSMLPIFTIYILLVSWMLEG